MDEMEICKGCRAADVPALYRDDPGSALALARAARRGRAARQKEYARDGYALSRAQMRRLVRETWAPDRSGGGEDDAAPASL